MSFGQGNQNPSGGSSSGPKVYRALLSQSGTDDPVATVLENTLGEVVWTRFDEGDYYGTLSGAFPSGKTFLPNHLTMPSGSPLYYYRGGDDYVEIVTTEADFPDPLYLEILVYP